MAHCQLGGQKNFRRWGAQAHQRTFAGGRRQLAKEEGSTKAVADHAALCFLCVSVFALDEPRVLPAREECSSSEGWTSLLKLLRWPSEVFSWYTSSRSLRSNFSKK